MSGPGTTEAPRQELQLDHASLRLRELTPALAAFTRWFGVAPVRSPGAAAHARHFIDGAYIELSEGAAPPGLSLWFLRYADAAQTRAWLEQEGFGVSLPRAYVGVDGTWEELHLEPPAALKEALLSPILVKRVSPEAIARNWPLPPSSHPFGDVRLARVLMQVASEGAAAWLTRLVGERISCTVVPHSPPRLSGLLFAVADFERLAAHLVDAGVEKAPGELWLREAEALGLQLGFTEARASR